MRAERFLDTNVVLYLLAQDDCRANRAETLVREGATISVQVLNEFTSVARRKLELSWREIEEVLQATQMACKVVPLTVETHERGRRLAERYGFAVYDAMIVASALATNCTVLYTEDMQDGLRVENQLTLENPFKAQSRGAKDRLPR